MSAQPTKPGIYRVKVYGTTTDCYWKYVSETNRDMRWIQLATLDGSNNAFNWHITPDNAATDNFIIRPAGDTSVAFGASTNNANKYWGYGFPQGYVTKAPLWTIKAHVGGYSTISLSDRSYVIDCLDTSSDKVLPFCAVYDILPSISDSSATMYLYYFKAVHFYREQKTKNQKWVFEVVDTSSPKPGPNKPADPNESGSDKPGSNKPGSNKPAPNKPAPNFGKSFEDLFFMLSPEEAAKQAYDIIIIGTGFGGGIIAGDLFDTNSMLGENALSVLVVEKGYLPFHTHSLNAARPIGFGEDRGQQNDTFFALFRDNFKFSPQTNTSDWKGGPMYNVGGRSAAWGLFLPRIHDTTLKTHFVADSTTWQDDLVRKWYRRAENLMNLSLPTTTPDHLNVMERLNMKNNSGTPVGISPRGVQWEWGHIASEFSEQKNFGFAKGAYSTIDKILEIAMSKARNADGSLIEHPNWRILVGTEVDRITWADNNNTATNNGQLAAGVIVRGPDGVEREIKLKPGSDGRSSRIVLAAGSVASPTILMRSGKEQFLKSNGGLHITDHDIFAKALTFNFQNPKDQEKVGAMKLQTYVNVRDEIVLANMSINADSFLPRTFLMGKYYRNTDYPKLVIAFIRPCELNEGNTIALDDSSQPIVTINRANAFSNSDPVVRDLQKMSDEIVEVLEGALGITVTRDEDEDEDNYFKPLELGGVAHELGTIPMKGKQGQRYCVEPDLQLRGHENIYVCDLSVFPYSPEVNPTLTLAALALRLSREVLLPPIPNIVQSAASSDIVVVLNQSGENVQVFVSNQAGVARAANDKPQILGPGKYLTCKRKARTYECVLVYRLAYNETDSYQTVPNLYLAQPGRGKVTLIN